MKETNEKDFTVESINRVLSILEVTHKELLPLKREFNDICPTYKDVDDYDIVCLNSIDTIVEDDDKLHVNYQTVTKKSILSACIFTIKKVIVIPKQIIYSTESDIRDYLLSEELNTMLSIAKEEMNMARERLVSIKDITNTLYNRGVLEGDSYD